MRRRSSSARGAGAGGEPPAQQTAPTPNNLRAALGREAPPCQVTRLHDRVSSPSLSGGRPQGCSKTGPGPHSPALPPRAGHLQPLPLSRPSWPSATLGSAALRPNQQGGREPSSGLRISFLGPGVVRDKCHFPHPHLIGRPPALLAAAGHRGLSRGAGGPRRTGCAVPEREGCPPETGVRRCGGGSRDGQRGGHQLPTAVAAGGRGLRPGLRPGRQRRSEAQLGSWLQVEAATRRDPTCTGCEGPASLPPPPSTPSTDCESLRTSLRFLILKLMLLL